MKNKRLQFKTPRLNIKKEGIQWGKIIVFSIAFVFILQAYSLQAEENDLLQTKITIDAEDASISSIISTMAKISGCNIVLAMDTKAEEQDVKTEKHLTLHLKDVPIENALSLVVKSVGLTYKLVGDKTFLVGKQDVIEQEVGERSYVVHLNYIEAAKIQKALDILPGECVPIEGQNALLISANPSSFAEIQNRIEEIDVPQKQIEIQARLIEISIKEAEKYGIDWSKLNHLTTILAEDPVNADGVGLPYDYSDPTGAEIFGKKEGNDIGLIPTNQYFQKLDGLKDIGHFSRQLTAFDVTIDWLLENNAAKLLTDTRITALNGEEANIHIGEVVPFVVEDNDKQIRVEREEVGIMLMIKPSINSAGQITTKIEPEVSSVMELVGGYIPRTKVRKAVTTVTVPNGKKIVIGGLLSSTLTVKTNKFPFLGDIPFIGKLFQHKEKEMRKTDLIIEITPRIVDLSVDAVETDIDKNLEKRLINPKQ